MSDRGGGIGNVVVRDKGAAEAATGGTRSVTNGVHDEERTVKLQPGLNLIMLSAFNGANEIETEPKERPALVLRFDPKVATKPVLRLRSPSASTAYTGKDMPKLANAAADAQGVATVMRNDPKHDVFGDVDAVVLTDAEATLANIDKAFDR